MTMLMWGVWYSAFIKLCVLPLKWVWRTNGERGIVMATREFAQKARVGVSSREETDNFQFWTIVEGGCWADRAEQESAS